MSVFKTIRDMMRPYIRGNVRPDIFDNGSQPAAPVDGSLLIEAGDLFLLETTDELLLE